MLHTITIHTAQDTSHAMLLVGLCARQGDQHNVLRLKAFLLLETCERHLAAALLVLTARCTKDLANLRCGRSHGKAMCRGVHRVGGWATHLDVIAVEQPSHAHVVLLTRLSWAHELRVVPSLHTVVQLGELGGRRGVGDAGLVVIRPFENATTEGGIALQLALDELGQPAACD